MPSRNRERSGPAAVSSRSFRRSRRCERFLLHDVHRHVELHHLTGDRVGRHRVLHRLAVAQREAVLVSETSDTGGRAAGYGLSGADLRILHAHHNVVFAVVHRAGRHVDVRSEILVLVAWDHLAVRQSRRRHRRL